MFGMIVTECATNHIIESAVAAWLCETPETISTFGQEPVGERDCLSETSGGLTTRPHGPTYWPVTLCRCNLDAERAESAASAYSSRLTICITDPGRSS